MNKNFKAGAQGGFTLIELIVVIVILGILAATALPKFVNLSTDARISSVQGAKGAMSAASGMLHGKFLVAGVDANSQITVEGVVVTPVNGYPDAAAIAALAGLDKDYTVSAVTGTTQKSVTVSPASATTASTCGVVYTEAAANSVPSIQPTTSGC